MASFDERRVRLAERIAEVEGVSFEEAVRKVPNDRAGVDRLVAALNARRGAPRNAAERKISAANRRSGRTGEDFSTAARFTR
jgi:hypothetical protein